MPRYVICASPLVKIYLQEWHDRLLAEPEEMYRMQEPEEPTWFFDIPHGCASMRIPFNKPYSVRGANDKEIETKFLWLIGESGHSQHETDLYGIVAFDPGIDLVERQDELARLESMLIDDPKKAAEARKKIAALQKDSTDRVIEMRKKLINMSEDRIKRAMKTVHNNLVKQWQINEEMKMGKHRPSQSEALGAYALDKEIKAAAAKGAKVYGNINKMMNANQASG
jgi:hypothetical protein